jgi:hypothetical protein
VRRLVPWRPELAWHTRPPLEETVAAGAAGVFPFVFGRKAHALLGETLVHDIGRRGLAFSLGFDRDEKGVERHTPARRGLPDQSLTERRQLSLDDGGISVLFGEDREGRLVEREPIGS